MPPRKNTTEIEAISSTKGTTAGRRLTVRHVHDKRSEHIARS
jgi:hypothetical protein